MKEENKIKCERCELLNDGEPIKVIIYKSKSPFSDDIYYFADGYKCLGTGKTALTVEELAEINCNKEL